MKDPPLACAAWFDRASDLRHRGARFPSCGNKNINKIKYLMNSSRIVAMPSPLIFFPS
jgi:hypothetical protein